MNQRIKVILADDHRVLREGLRLMLRSEAGIEVVAEADDGRTAVRLAGELSPDVVVMDINMPDMDGIEATRRITAGHGGADPAQAGHTPKVVALSAHANRRFTTDMLRAGASGYVVKESAFEELARAVRAVVAGKIYLSPGVADGVVEDFSRGGPAGSPATWASLSPREREVLQLMADGKATKEVAFHLSVSIKTVETHRRNLMEKLGLDNVADLTKFALREGVTSLDA